MSTPSKRDLTDTGVGSLSDLVLGRYQLRRQIGAGGMGIVYLAHDEQLEREVAVKRIAVELDPDGRGEREAIAAARLSHPAIVALYESGRDEHALYLVSEFVHGRTLAELIAAGELSDRDVGQIGMALCDALEHAHARGIVHCDVKPSNIICPEVDDDGRRLAKLMDFGIARMADGDMLTWTGDILGTLAYMAPEQARGLGVTGAADVYALGLVLYESLSGVNPVRAGNPAATARRIGAPVPPLGRVRRDLPSPLCLAIDAAVVSNPDDRISLGPLRTALTNAVQSVSGSAGPTGDAPLATAAGGTARDRTANHRVTSGGADRASHITRRELREAELRMGGRAPADAMVFIGFRPSKGAR